MSKCEAAGRHSRSSSEKIAARDHAIDLAFLVAMRDGTECGPEQTPEPRAMSEPALDTRATESVGLCCFQREWAESRLDDLLVGAGIDPGDGAIAHHRRLAARLARSAPVAFWRGARVREIVATWARECAVDDPDDRAAAAQAEAFERDPTGAASAFYAELRTSIAEGLDLTGDGY